MPKVLSSNIGGDMGYPDIFRGLPQAIMGITLRLDPFANHPTIVAADTV
jgi:hypothetical protein